MTYSLGLGATQYVIPPRGTFTGMFNVRGLASGQAAAAASAIGVEVRTIRGGTWDYVGWGSGRDAGIIVARGTTSSDVVPSHLLSLLRNAATRAKARLGSSVTIDTTLKHVPTVARTTETTTTSETAPSPETPPPVQEEPFYLQTVFGMPVWVLGLVGIGGIAVVLITGRKKTTPTPAFAKNRRHRRSGRRLRRVN